MTLLSTLLLILVQAASAHAGGSTTSSLSSPLEVGGISIGQSEAAVAAALGKPNQRTEEPDHYLPITLFYPGLIISLDDQGVGGVLSTSERFCTSAKVCPGMAYKQVEEAYGTSEPYEREGRIFRDYLWDDSCWLRVEFDGDAVLSVDATCSP